ncbi:MAG: hypothetical protein QM813_12230 [Verrucomicrobiota bacterium]
MKRRIDQEQLLNDVLAPESTPNAEAALLNHVLRLAHRRRRWRQGLRFASALVLMAVVSAGLLFYAGRQKPGVEQARKSINSPGFQTITSFALTPGQIIITQPLLPGQLVQSENAVTEVRTAASGVPSINDEKLLELARPNIAALVRRGASEAELVFVKLPGAAN